MTSSHPITNSFDLLRQGLMSWDVNIDETTLLKFRQFYSLILEWNNRFNLTSITDERDVVIKHFLDSLSILKRYTFTNQSVIDIGTGAGFPGIPLKLLFPDIKIVFVDSSAKKTKFLNTVCNALGITNFQIINDNIENVGKEVSFRESFDIAITRALSELRILIEYCVPLLKVGGMLISYKGPNCQREVENSAMALNALRAEIKENTEITLPFTDLKRKFIIVEKLGKTDLKYPRNVGIPKKRPL